VLWLFTLDELALAIGLLMVWSNLSFHTQTKFGLSFQLSVIKVLYDHLLCPLKKIKNIKYILKYNLSPPKSSPKQTLRL